MQSSTKIFIIIGSLITILVFAILIIIPKLEFKTTSLAAGKQFKEAIEIIKNVHERDCYNYENYYTSMSFEYLIEDIDAEPNNGFPYFGFGTTKYEYNGMTSYVDGMSYKKTDLQGNLMYNPDFDPYSLNKIHATNYFDNKKIIKSKVSLKDKDKNITTKAEQYNVLDFSADYRKNHLTDTLLYFSEKCDENFLDKISPTSNGVVDADKLYDIHLAMEDANIDYILEFMSGAMLICHSDVSKMLEKMYNYLVEYKYVISFEGNLRFYIPKFKKNEDYYFDFGTTSEYPIIIKINNKPLYRFYIRICFGINHNEFTKEHDKIDYFYDDEIENQITYEKDRFEINSFFGVDRNANIYRL